MQFLSKVVEKFESNIYIQINFVLIRSLEMLKCSKIIAFISLFYGKYKLKHHRKNHKERTKETSE